MSIKINKKHLFPVSINGTMVEAVKDGESILQVFIYTYEDSRYVSDIYVTISDPMYEDMRFMVMQRYHDEKMDTLTLDDLIFKISKQWIPEVHAKWEEEKPASHEDKARTDEWEEDRQGAFNKTYGQMNVAMKETADSIQRLKDMEIALKELWEIHMSFKKEPFIDGTVFLEARDIEDESGVEWRRAGRFFEVMLTIEEKGRVVGEFSKNTGIYIGNLYCLHNSFSMGSASWLINVKKPITTSLNCWNMAKFMDRGHILAPFMSVCNEEVDQSKTWDKLRHEIQEQIVNPFLPLPVNNLHSAVQATGAYFQALVKFRNLALSIKERGDTLSRMIPGLFSINGW